MHDRNNKLPDDDQYKQSMIGVWHHDMNKDRTLSSDQYLSCILFLRILLRLSIPSKSGIIWEKVMLFKLPKREEEINEKSSWDSEAIDGVDQINKN